MKLLAGIDDLFDHLAQLVDFNRENAAIFVAVTELAHGSLKRAVNRFDSVTQQILKPDDKRETEPPIAGLIDNGKDVDGAPVFLQRPRHDVAGAINGKVIATPSIDVVSGDGGLDVPLSFHFGSRRADKSQPHIESARRTCKPCLKKFSCQAFERGALGRS